MLVISCQSVYLGGVALGLCVLHYTDLEVDIYLQIRYLSPEHHNHLKDMIPFLRF